jgi:hypothetical protein
MKIPTEAEIKAEILKLTTMKPTVLMSSMFGDNHHDAIDAQIEVLEERLDSDDVYDRYPSIEEDEDNGYPANVRDSAIEAAMWMEGESEDGSPSENWQSLVRK